VPIPRKFSPSATPRRVPPWCEPAVRSTAPGVGRRPRHAVQSDLRVGMSGTCLRRDPVGFVHQRQREWMRRSAVRPAARGPVGEKGCPGHSVVAAAQAHTPGPETVVHVRSTSASDRRWRLDPKVSPKGWAPLLNSLYSRAIGDTPISTPNQGFAAAATPAIPKASRHLGGRL